MPITRRISCSSFVPTDGSSGRHDNYGSALSAQPGRSQGRPATNASSRLIEFIGLPTGVLPVPLVRDGRTIRREASDPSRARGHRDPHTGYQHARTLEPETQAPPHIVRIFPNGESGLRLVRALAVEMHENWLEATRYTDLRKFLDTALISSAKSGYRYRL